MADDDPLARLAARGRAGQPDRERAERARAEESQERERGEEAERRARRRAEEKERVAFASYEWAAELQWFAYLVGVLGMIGGSTLLPPNEDFPGALDSLGGLAILSAGSVALLFLLARPALRARGAARTEEFLRTAGVPIDEDAFYEALGRYTSHGNRLRKAEGFGRLRVELLLSPGPWVDGATLQEALAGAVPGSKLDHHDDRAVVIVSPTFDERVEALVWFGDLVARFVPALSARRPVERVIPRG